jgi:hypothetical protein
MKTTMMKSIHGKVHGRTIELDEDLGVADGQDVEVRVNVVASPKRWGDGIFRTAGALADDPEWDAIMEEVYHARKLERPPKLEIGGSPDWCNR